MICKWYSLFYLYDLVDVLSQVIFKLISTLDACLFTSLLIIASTLLAVWIDNLSQNKHLFHSFLFLLHISSNYKKFQSYTKKIIIMNPIFSSYLSTHLLTISLKTPISLQISKQTPGITLFLVNISLHVSVSKDSFFLL